MENDEKQSEICNGVILFFVSQLQKIYFAEKKQKNILTSNLKKNEPLLSITKNTETLLERRKTKSQAI